MFQPRRVSPPYLGSITIITILNYPYRHTCFNRFSILFICFQIPTSNPSIAIHFRSNISVFTYSPLSLPARSAAHLYISHAYHPPAPDTCLCFTCYVPESFDVVVTVQYPFVTLIVSSIPCQPLGYSLVASPPGSPVPPPCLPKVLLQIVACSVPWFCCLVHFCGRGRGQDAFTPWTLLPPLLGPTGAVHANPTTLPPIPTLLLSLSSVGHSDKSW